MPITMKELLLKHNIISTHNHRDIFQVKCAVCNDYRVRAGFFFNPSDDGYNCWNCGHKAKYIEGSGKMSSNFRTVLGAFGIPQSEISKFIVDQILTKKDLSEPLTAGDFENTIDTSVEPISLPNNSKKLFCGNIEQNVEEEIAQYLLSRNIDPKSIPFYYNPAERYHNLVIIPCYKFGKMVYWVGRNFREGSQRFVASSSPKHNVIFNMDALYKTSEEPLFVCEGIFNALSVRGVATLGSSLSKGQKKLLGDSHRRLIFCVENDKTGKQFLEAAIELKKEVVFLRGDDCNKVSQKKGELFLTKFLMDNVVDVQTAVSFAKSFAR